MVQRLYNAIDVSILKERVLWYLAQSELDKLGRAYYLIFNLMISYQPRWGLSQKKSISFNEFMTLNVFSFSNLCFFVNHEQESEFEITKFFELVQ